MYILYSKTHGYLQEVDQDGDCYWTDDRAKARIFPIMYHVALMFTEFGVSNFPPDLLNELANPPTRN